MARFDVYANPDLQERKRIPFFLDVQNDHIKGFQTRVMVPLWDATVMPALTADLNPDLQVKGQRVVMDTPALGAVPLAAFKGAVDNLGTQQLAIQNALNTLFGSY